MPNILSTFHNSAPVPIQGQLEGYMEIPVVFKTGPRPAGTPGKHPFCMRDVMGLDDPTYTLVLDGIRTICIQHGLVMSKSIKRQHQPTLRKVYARAAEVFPGFNDFDNPVWPVHCFVYIAIKSKMDQLRTGRRKQSLALAKALAAGQSHIPGSPSDAARRAARRAARQEAGRKAARTRLACKAASQASAAASNDDPVGDMTRKFSMAAISAGDTPGQDNDIDEDMGSAPFFPPLLNVDCDGAEGLVPPPVHEVRTVVGGQVLARPRPRPRIPVWDDPTYKPTRGLTPTGTTIVASTHGLPHATGNTPSSFVYISPTDASAHSCAIDPVAPTAPAPDSTCAPSRTPTPATQVIANSVAPQPTVPARSSAPASTKVTCTAPAQVTTTVEASTLVTDPAPTTRRAAADKLACATVPNPPIPFSKVSSVVCGHLPGTLFEAGAPDPEASSSGGELSDAPESDAESKKPVKGKSKKAAAPKARGRPRGRGRK